MTQQGICFESFLKVLLKWLCFEDVSTDFWLLGNFVINLELRGCIVIANQKIVWKSGGNCWYFRLNLKYLGWPNKAHIKTAKNGGFCEELISENYSEAVLATFCCYHHSANAFEVVQKIATDQKEYYKCSSCVIIWWIAKTYLSINNSEKRPVNT